MTSEAGKMQHPRISTTEPVIYRREQQKNVNGWRQEESPLMWTEEWCALGHWGHFIHSTGQNQTRV